MVTQNEVLSYLFVNPPLDKQILVPFMIVACREFDLRIRSKLVNKMTEYPDEPSAALLEITVNALYGTFIAIKLADAEPATVWCMVVIEFFLHMKTAYRIISERNRVVVKNVVNEETPHSLRLVHLVTAEILEAFIPIIHGICIALAYYGPNANLFANIGSSYWGEAIDDIGPVFTSMMILFTCDILIAIATSLWLWKRLNVNMLQEFQRTLARYWLYMLIKIAWLEGAYIGTTDVNFGIDSSGKFLWIDAEGWTNLINATNHLIDEEKSSLLNSTLLM